jgi:hypothetical protein
VVSEGIRRYDLPGHMINYMGVFKFVIFPKEVAHCGPSSLGGYRWRSIQNQKDWLLASNPDFFEKLLSKMTEISGQSTNMVYRPVDGRKNAP